MKNLIEIHIVFSFLIIRTETSDNIALNKPTQQSSVFTKVPNIWTSDKAVDGNARNDATVSDHNTCIITDSNDTITTVWWYVDLVERSRILQVEIVYRNLFAYRLAGFSLFVSEKPYVSDNRPMLCYKHTSTVLPAYYQTLSCNTTGRYVTVYNERLPNVTYPSTYSTDAMLELCEVRVKGCQIGKFGNGDCNSDCSVGCVNGDCYPNNGTCVQGCLHGWMSPECDICLPGVYCNLCEKSCSMGCNSTSCQRIDGECPCKQNWSGYVCDRCRQGLYGESCEYNCSYGCLYTECTKADGTCTQCKVGWSGQKCDVCIDGRYGLHCELNCLIGCDQKCTKTDGTCKCKNGWSGTNCEDCSDGFFGKTCEGKCSSGCKYMICNKTDGTCERWIGNACNVCTDGLFGNFCERNCSFGCNRSFCDKIDGTCECKEGWSGEKCEELSLAPSPTNQLLHDGAIAGVTIGVIVLVICTVIIVILIQKKRNAKKIQRKTQYTDLCLKPNSEFSQSRNENPDYSSLHEQTALDRKRPICLSGIRQWMAEMHKDGNLKFAQEFESKWQVNQYKADSDLLFDKIVKIPIHTRKYNTHRLNNFIKTTCTIQLQLNHLKLYKQKMDLKASSPSKPCTVGEMAQNRHKNRNANVFPFDYNRVKLSDGKHQSSTEDYINASFIKNHDNKLNQDYIATQEPLTNTVEDFWSMVWQQNVSIIVMLTERGDYIGKYFPTESQASKQYGTFSVKTGVKLILKNSEFTSITLSKGKKSRNVKHFRCCRWSAAYNDEFKATIFDFIGVVRSNTTSEDKTGPTVVQCSDGTGPTGIHIALSKLIDCVNDNFVDIFELTLFLRENRMQSVENEHQYVFIHDCFLYFIDKMVPTTTSTMEIADAGNTYDYI